jgi:hypothetical protein
MDQADYPERKESPKPYRRRDRGAVMAEPDWTLAMLVAI